MGVTAVGLIGVLHLLQDPTIPCLMTVQTQADSVCAVHGAQHVSNTQQQRGHTTAAIFLTFLQH